MINKRFGVLVAALNTLGGCDLSPKAVQPIPFGNTSVLATQVPSGATVTKASHVQDAAHQPPVATPASSTSEAEFGNSITGCPDGLKAVAKNTMMMGSITITYMPSTEHLQCPAIFEVNGFKASLITISGIPYPDETPNIAEVAAVYETALTSPVGTTLRFEYIDRSHGVDYPRQSNVLVEASTAEKWNGHSYIGTNLRSEYVTTNFHHIVFTVTYIHPSPDVILPIRILSDTQIRITTYKDLLPYKN